MSSISLLSQFVVCGDGDRQSACDAGELRRLAHCNVVKYGLMVDGYVRHSLISMYARCGELGCARKVFDEIADRDLVSWNSMISGCVGVV
ncbi:pentatricopeptide repeat-containing protein [Tanacetum coccineum]